MLEKAVASLLIAVLMLCVVAAAGAKEHSRFVTAEMRANALANVEKYDWAKAEQAKEIEFRKRWLEMSDDEIWQMVTSQDLPRGIHTNVKAGCPSCGKAITPYGNYPWRPAGDWKLKCPNCGAIFPKNDFRAFYESALDEHGFFHRELGDQSLLFNAEHPDPKDPLHKVYVDDGYGMMDEQGNKHLFIGYYNNYRWAVVASAAFHLAQTYTLTSDPRYAHKAAVLLDRVADVYPDMDLAPFCKLGFAHSHGGWGTGRIWGCLCENDNVWRFSRAYDSIFDALVQDEELVAFSSAKSQQCKLGDKSSTAAIVKHIEDHLLLEMLNSYKDGRIDGNKARIRNPAAAAIALDKPGVTEQWLDYMFAPGFPGPHYRQPNPIPFLLVEGVDRGGMGSMCSGYGLYQTSVLMDLVEVLAAYPQYTKHNILEDYPKLRQTFLIEPRLRCLDEAVPNIGDSGFTGRWSHQFDQFVFLRGYRLYKDPRMAALAWRYAGGDATKLRMPHAAIYEPDPEALVQELAAAASAEGHKLKCEHTGRYGQVVLQAETPEEGRALWMHHGFGNGHSHKDCLTIGLYAKNIDMLPDLGYPEYTGGWPKTHAWTINTISHNTLQVNNSASGYSPGGKMTLFAVQPPVRVVDVSSLTAYSGMRTYRRMAALVDVSDTDSYVYDVFRARGGTDHRLSYNGPAQTATVAGIQLAEQPTGTFMGPDVPFAKLDGDNAALYKTTGFTYLYDVARSGAPVAKPFTVDWKGEDLRDRIKEGKEPHLRLHSLSQSDEVATAAGDPPQNKPGNPRRLRYLIQSRLGEDMESQFVTVLEPYDTTPFIKGVRKLQVEHDADANSVAAVAVEMLNGTTDILISCEGRIAVKVEGGIEFDGQFGMIRLINGEVKLMRMSNATLLKLGEVALKADVPAYEGIVTAIDISDPMNNTVSLDPPLPEDETLIGKVIHFLNDLPLDTSYDIKGVTGEKISTGDITIIRRFKDNEDFEAGYEYLANPGDSYIVPCHYKLER